MKPTTALKQLTTMELAIRYGVSVRLIEQWKRYEGFPRHAGARDGNRVLWDHILVDAWLRRRPLAHNGVRPKWLTIVQHPAATGDPITEQGVHPQ